MGQLSYDIALAYSNVQGEGYEISPVIVALMASSDNLSELEQLSIPDKDSLMNSPTEQHNVFEQCQSLLDDYDCIELEPKRANANAIGAAYVDLVENLLKGTLFSYVARVREISYRKLLNIPGFNEVELQNEYERKLRQYSDNLLAKSDKDTGALFQLARTMARMRYEELREQSPQFALATVQKDPTRYSHFLRLSYRSPDPHDFSSYFVGYPTLAIRFADGSLTSREVRLGMELAFRPVGRFCAGIRISGSSHPCLRRSTEMPFGLPISIIRKEERCPSCKLSTEYLNCLFTKPACDGTKVVCGNDEFAGQVCTSNFGLYVTRISDVLKVGSAFLPNLVGRLLEQGANSALLIYPLEGVEHTYERESSLEHYLDKNGRHLYEDFHLRAIQKKTTTAAVRLDEFSNQWNRNDHDLLEVVERILLSEKSPFRKAEMKIVSFLHNYHKPPMKPSGLTLSGKASKIDPIKGRVTGYRGSFIFLDNDGGLNVKNLQGYAMEDLLC